jgi:hypothetical protein
MRKSQPRSAVGAYVFSVTSSNERLLAEAGFRILRCEDMTEEHWPQSAGAGTTPGKSSVNS